MSISRPLTTPPLSRKRRALYTAVVLFTSLAVVVFLSEIILKFRRNHIQKSSLMDSGMIFYDRYLGWKLAPNWRGRHRHYDFDVQYSTNRFGFRGSFGMNREKYGPVYAFVGDSFTFSFGVNDHETFAEILNSRAKGTATFLNFGIPGYSTDQEYLLIKERVISFRPTIIFLVVYLANDLFDNERAFPLQANRAKPYFQLTPGGLILRNVPVPLERKSDEQSRTDLAQVVMGVTPSREGPLGRFLNRFEIYRLLGPRLSTLPGIYEGFEGRFGHALRLFRAITEETEKICLLNRIGLVLVLMPGKSFVERPESLSARYQDYLRKRILEISREKGLYDVIDLAEMLRSRYQENPGKWFHPHEGHLTAEGQRVVADILGPSVPETR